MRTKTAPAADLPPAFLRGMPEPTEAEIQKEAYYQWIEHGRPDGRDVEFWHAAQEILRHRATPAPVLPTVHFPPNPSALRPVTKPARR